MYKTNNKFKGYLRNITLCNSLKIHKKEVRLLDKNYKQYVDVIWNMQPIRGVVNLDKSNNHPKLFFTDANVKGKLLTGKKYYNDYDCIPDMNSADWDDYKLFIENRRTKMLKEIKNHYGITLVP